MKMIGIDVIVAALIGLAVGAGGVAAFNHKKPEAPAPIIVNPHEGTDEAIKNLTALDLTEPICKPEFIEKKGNLLCRELTCMQFSRGLDSQTAGAQCESISNIANKIQILEACSEIKDDDKKKECLELFWKRN